jgi:protocatechuate 3,4-dioxygenase beta subunit
VNTAGRPSARSDPKETTVTETTQNPPGEELPSQQLMSAEIDALHREYEEQRRKGAPELLQPSLDYPPYRSSLLRHPTKDPKLVDPETIELLSPAFGHRDVAPVESDLTVQHSGEPLGERMIVAGRVLDGDGRPVRQQLVEIWQANAAGRYIHKRDQHPAPLDPNFTGAGRCITDDDGRYRFVTIKPGAYPWRNHANAWRPAHIHFSLFGNAFTQRIVTQMYFPSDPLFPLDPIYNSIADPKARERLVAGYDHDLTSPEWALGYRWDIVLTGSERTWTEPEEGDH